MNALLLIPACMLMGMVVARLMSPPTGMIASLNWWVINIALPALVLNLIPKLHYDPDLWFLVASQWLVFIGAALLMHTVGTRLNWSRGRIGALILVCGLGNTSFIGYPMLEALRGQDGLALGVVADQLGCFVMLSVGGVLVTTFYGHGSSEPKQMLKKILLFPAFIALAVGLLVGALGGWPTAIEQILLRIGQSLTPLALFSVGMRLRLQIDRHHWTPIAIGLSWKLAAAPVIMLGLSYAFAVSAPVMSIAVLQAAMAPMISAAILAEQNELEPDLANAILGVGILLSLASVPSWHHWLP